MAKFEMDTEFVRKLAQILHETHLGEIELADGRLVPRSHPKALLKDPAEVAERYGVPVARAGEAYAELALLRPVIRELLLLTSCC